jgi:hypothetical protein
MLAEVPIRPRHFVALLCRSGQYAACEIDMALKIAFAPSLQRDWMPETTVCGALTAAGLAEVLEWTTRGDALSRYQGMLPNFSRADQRAMLRLC